jgi:hypothetical protein
LKKDDQKAYPEVAPHCPLSVSIRRIRRKTTIGPTSGSRTSVTAPRDLARVVQMHEVTQDSINVTEPPQKGVRLQDQLERFSVKREYNQHT